MYFVFFLNKDVLVFSFFCYNMFKKQFKVFNFMSLSGLFSKALTNPFVSTNDVTYRLQQLHLTSRHPTRELVSLERTASLKSLTQAIRTLSNQIIESIPSPFSKTDASLQLSAVIQKENDLTPAIHRISKQASYLRLNTLSALNLNSSIDSKPKTAPSPSILDTLDIERQEKKTNSTASMLDSDFMGLAKKAFSYVKTPLEYVVNSKQKLTESSEISMPRGTSKFIKNTFQNRPVKAHRLLGKGVFGVVNLVESGEEMFAKKTILLDPKVLAKTPHPDVLKQKTQEYFKKEASLLMTFDHPNIVKVEAVSPDGIYLEYMKDGSLDTILKSNDLTEKEVVTYLLDIVETLSYLHEKGYTYKDLKTQNILISRNPIQAKLCDFGLTTPTKEDREKSGSPFNIAPEIKYTIPGKIDPISQQADIWSLGCVMFEMITGGCNPYPQLKNETSSQYHNRISKSTLNKPCNNASIFQLINNQAKIFMKARDPKGTIKSLIVECLNGTASKRPSTEEIKNKLLYLI